MAKIIVQSTPQFIRANTNVILIQSESGVVKISNYLQYSNAPFVGIAGQVLSTFTVEVYANLSLDVGFVGNVSLTITSGPGSLSGTTTQPLANGIATFDDIIPSAEGTITITASAAGAISVNTSIIIAEGAVGPPTANLIQYTAKPNGLDIYEDTAGINIQDGWFLPDNVSNRQLRTIQPGRGYNFTGVEYVDFGYISSIDLEDFSCNLTFDSQLTLGTIAGINLAAGGTFGGIRISNWIDNTIAVRVYWNIGGTYNEYFSSNLITTGLNILRVSISGGAVTIVLNGVTTGTSLLNTPINGANTKTSLGLQWTDSTWTWGSDVSTYLFEINTKLICNLDESAGLVSYDASGNGNDGTIALGGSAESSFHITDNSVPSIQNLLGHWFSNDALNDGNLVPINQAIPTQDVLGNTPPSTHLGQVRYEERVKGSSVGSFDGVLYGTASDNYDGKDANNFIFEADIILKEVGNVVLLNYRGNRTTAGSGTNIGGFLIFSASGDIKIAYSPVDVFPHEIITWSTNLLIDTLYSVKIIKDGIDAELYINGISQGSLSIDATFRWSSLALTLLGAWQWIGDIVVGDAGQINRIYLKDTDSLEILINHRFSETNGLVWHNIAADAPANSHCDVILGGSSDGDQWSTSDLQRPKNLIDGYQLYQKTSNYDILVPIGITVDPSITGLGYTKTGDIAGSLKTINPAESVYDRNPMDAPELVLIGVPKDEDISYTTITADQTRYYKLNGTIIEDMLVYSDVGGEPITPGSMTAPELVKHNEIRAYLDA